MKLIPITEHSKAPTEACAEVHNQTLAYYKIIGYSEPWISYYLQDNGEFVGTCAFKGSPDAQGKVEIAYYTFEQFQSKGYGSAMCSLLIDIAKTQGNILVSAQTLPAANASTAILTKNGFRHIGSAVDDEAGEVWEWVLDRQNNGGGKNMSLSTDMAAALFDSGFNCAQSVTAVFCEKYGTDKETVLKMSSGFGGGFRCGEICGAASGAALVIGLKHGQYMAEDKAAKANCNSKTVEFMNLFRDKNKSVVCREILKFDLSVKEEYEQAQNQNLFKTTCADMVKSAVTLLEELGY